VTAEEVGVHVRLEHPLDREPVLLRVAHVDRHVALRVDDHGPARGLVAHEVGSVRQTVEVVLLEDHEESIPPGVYADGDPPPAARSLA